MTIDTGSIFCRNPNGTKLPALILKYRNEFELELDRKQLEIMNNLGETMGEKH